MAKKGASKLTIYWQSQQPPVKAERWVGVDFAKPATEKSDAKTEEKLEWPKGTTGVLRSAFEEKLGRFDGWDLKKPSKPAAKAAEVYRRGVSCRAAKKENKITKHKGSYDIVFSNAESFDEFLNKNNSLCVTDKNLAKHWPVLTKRPNALVIDLDEKSKTLASVAKIYEKGKSFDHWFSLGGGVLCDTASFAAALAGKEITFIPTTLLAMADACVGGKTGVNFEPYGKNQIGSFYFPKEVVIWSQWLKTLPRRELLAGASECFKHGYLVGDRKLVTGLLAWLDGQMQLDELLPTIVEIKAKVVEEDPMENGKRATLNFGHTMGHALESYSHKHHPKDYLLHGESVACGMAFAALLSEECLGLAKKDVDLILGSLFESGCFIDQAKLCKHLGVKKLSDGKLWDELAGLLLQDKKAAKQEVRWVLFEELGKPALGSGKYTVPVAVSEVEKVWKKFIKLYP